VVLCGVVCGTRTLDYQRSWHPRRTRTQYRSPWFTFVPQMEHRVYHAQRTMNSSGLTEMAPSVLRLAKLPRGRARFHTLVFTEEPPTVRTPGDLTRSHPAHVGDTCSRTCDAVTAACGGGSGWGWGGYGLGGNREKKVIW